MKTGTKAGLFGLVVCGIVALLMAMPVSAVSGYYQKVTVFSDNFDVRNTVDFDEWETQVNQDDYSIDFDALNVSWDYGARDAADTLNFSYGIYTQTDITNDTIYSDNDIYLQQSGFIPFEMWEGIIDDANLGADMPIDGEDGVGQVGVVFVNSYHTESGLNTTANGIYVWYVDTADTLQLEEVDVDMTSGRWYNIEKTYTPDTKEATINVTDTVTDETDTVNVTHIRFPSEGLRQIFFGWDAVAPIYYFNKNGQPLAASAWDSIALVDNVDIYGYTFVPSSVTPPPAITTANWAQDIGKYMGVTGAILTIAGVIAYADLSKYLSSIGYQSHAAMAAIPVGVGLAMIGLGAGYYYGYMGAVAPLW